MSNVIAVLERAAHLPPGSAQLAALLEAWRIAPSPRLHGLIDELSRRLAEAPVGRRKPWLAELAAWRPEALPGLVEGLLQAQWAEYEHAEALLAREPDPRFGAADRRLYQKFRDHIPLIERLLRPHRLGPAELPPAAIAMVDSIGAALATVHDVESRLRANVFADPHDDMPRMVYADYLQQRGDPRGELMALQLANAPGNEKSRLQALEKHLFSRCLGALEHAVTSGRLERGFVVEAVIGWNMHALAAVVDRPDWATVRKLTLAKANGATVVAALLGNPALAGLEELYGVTLDALVGFTGALPALQRLGLAVGDVDDVDRVMQLRLDALPAVMEVSVAGIRLAEAVRRCPLGPQLERLEVACYPAEVALCLLDHGTARSTLVVTAMHEVYTLRDRILHTRRVAPLALAAMLDELPPNAFREVHVAERLAHADYARVGMAAGRHGGLLMSQNA